MSDDEVIRLEQRYGNGDLIKVLDILGIAGPFQVLSPWELQDPQGRHLIHAGGYAALPFGENYLPLRVFVQRYLEQSRSMALPQQSATAWRAALESNLVHLLASYAPSHQDSQVFFSNSGAEAVEAALKFVRAARPQARYLISFTRGYHGKTAGALSLTPNEEYQAPFRPLLPAVLTLPYGDANALQDCISRYGADNIAGIIVEPIQGEGGVVKPPEDFLPALEALRQRYGILCIADEIQSGLGRSGHWFASLAAGLDPDIITLAKPLGGGLVAIGATIARAAIVRKALGGLSSKRHSNTFGGGSLAMAVGLKSLELLVDNDAAAQASYYEARGLARLRSLKERYPQFVQQVRAAGMLFALQLQPPLPLPAAWRALPQELLAQLGSALALSSLHRAGLHACYTLNASQVIRLTPALTMPEPLFDTMFDRLAEAAAQHPHSYSQLSNAAWQDLLELAKLALRSS